MKRKYLWEQIKQYHINNIYKPVPNRNMWKGEGNIWNILQPWNQMIIVMGYISWYTIWIHCEALHLKRDVYVNVLYQNFLFLGGGGDF